MDSFKEILKLEEKLIELTYKTSKDFKQKGELFIPNRIEYLERIYYFLFLKFSSEFFYQRSKFFMKSILNENFNNEEKGITKTVFRGLIEIITKIEYARRERKEFVKRYLWELIESEFLILSLGGKISSEEKNRIKAFYEDLKFLDPSLPDLNLLYEEYNTLQNLNVSFDKNNIFCKNHKRLKFPSVRQLIFNYWNDENLLKKVDAYKYYKIFSNPIHANLIFEGVGKEVKTIDYQLLTFLITLHQKFINGIKEEISEKLKLDINKTLQEIKIISIDFIKSYLFRRKIFNKL